MPRVIALVGPTGSGKSSVALEVARRLPGVVELVAVDAFTIYRGMDIGTATPSRVEREEFPHHMVDLLDPQEACSVQWFQQRARRAVEGIWARGRTPLLVGGSGLYFRAVVDPLEFPPTDEAVRGGLLESWGTDPSAAHAHLAARDPEAAARIDPLNLRRTVRALEVIALTGRTFSSFGRAWSASVPIWPGLAVVGIDVPRADLGPLLAARTQSMLDAGWLDEVRSLVDGEAVHGPMSQTARQAIGYAELRAHLEGAIDLPAAMEQVAVRTRRFAVRQQRWFSQDPRVGWVPRERAAEAVCAHLVDRAPQPG